MKKFSKFICLILSLCVLLPTFGCKGRVSDSFTSFGSLVTISAKGLNDEIIENIKEKFNSLEEEFSVSTLGTTNAINKLKANSTINVSSRYLEVIEKCNEMYEFTDKKFNPAIYPLTKLWGFSIENNSENFNVPKKSEIDNLLNSNIIDFSLINIDKTNNSLFKLKDEVMLDFGGVIKGYATNLALDILLENDIVSGYVNVGGSSLSIIKASSFKIRHPENKNTEILEVYCDSLSNFSISTSGTYEKTHTYNGKTYSHIINGFTGAPTETGIISATVVLNDGIVAEALSTALCLTNVDIGDVQNSELGLFINKIIDAFPSAQIFTVYKKGQDKFIITNKIKGENFALLDNNYNVIEI